MQYSAWALLALLACGCGGHGSAAKDLGGADQSFVSDLSGAVDAATPDDLAGPADDLATVDLAPDLARPAPDLAQMQGGCMSDNDCAIGQSCCRVGIRAGQCYNPMCLACCM